MRRTKQGAFAQCATRGVALMLAVVSAATVSFPWWARSLAPSAGAQTGDAAAVGLDVPDATVDEPTEAVADAGTVARAPIDPEQLPGVHTWPRRQPPLLLTEAQVEAGLGDRLLHMQGKQVTRNLRKGTSRGVFGTDDGGSPPFDQDPPRQPLPPPASESLAQ